VQVIISRRVIWSGHITRIGEGRDVYRVLMWKPDGNPGADGRIILRWIFRKWVVGVLTGLSWLRIEKGGRHV
jgi:hypothetical protein